MSSSTSKSPKSTCTQSNSSWNNATHWIHISHLATTWPEPVLNLTAGKEVILRKPTTWSSTGNLTKSKLLAHRCILTSLPPPQRSETGSHLKLLSTALPTFTTQCRHRPWTASHHPDIQHNTSWLVVACGTLSTQTLDGKLPSGHTWYKRTCDRLL